MLAIRLQRTGRKHEPTFRVVLTDSENGPKSGKYLENLGWYDTRLKNKAAEQLNLERVKYWMSQGAKPSVTLHNFLVSEKVIAGEKLNALPKKTPIKKETPSTEQTTTPTPTPTEQAPAPEPAPVPEPTTTETDH